MSVTPTKDERPAADALDDEAACPRCATPYEPGQEYCLECGIRLPAARGVGATLASRWQRRLGYYPGDWIWPVLVGLLIAGLATGVVIAVTSDGSARTTLVATGPTVSIRTTRTTASPTQATTGPATSEATTAATTPPPPPPARPANRLTAWPAGANGYTVVLESLPTNAGRTLAVRKAKAALAKGLEDVGVLNSSLFSSLHPGYYVVFSGIFDSLAEAEQAESKAQASGYAAAYARQVIS